MQINSSFHVYRAPAVGSQVGIRSGKQTTRLTQRASPHPTPPKKKFMLRLPQTPGSDFQKQASGKCSRSPRGSDFPVGFQNAKLAKGPERESERSPSPNSPGASSWLVHRPAPRGYPNPARQQPPTADPPPPGAFAMQGDPHSPGLFLGVGGLFRLLGW